MISNSLTDCLWAVLVHCAGGMRAERVRFWLLRVMGFLYVSMGAALKESFMQTFYMFYMAKEKMAVQNMEKRRAESLSD